VTPKAYHALARKKEHMRNATDELQLWSKSEQGFTDTTFLNSMVLK